MSFSTEWRRPFSVPYPQVWSRFEKVTKDGKIVKFKIQDVTEDHYDGVLELFTKEYLADEPWFSNAGFPDSPVSREAITAYLLNVVFPQKVTAVCFLEDEKETKPTIVGYNFLAVCCKNEVEELDDSTNSEPLRILDLLFKLFQSSCPNIYEKYNVEKYLGAMGLCVNRKYRGLGISTELLNARIPLCKAIGINVTNTIFSSIAAQKSARKAGFKVDAVLSYDKFRDATALEFKNCVNCEMLSLVIK